MEMDQEETSITFPMTLQKYATYDSSSLELQNCIYIIALAEYANNSDNSKPWMIEPLLNKRRGPYNFDRHLQQMLLAKNRIGSFSARCINCGPSGLRKTELYDNAGNVIHFNYSFDRNAKYNKEYLKMNSDPEKPRFFYFQYGLDETRTKVTSLYLIAPLITAVGMKIEIMPMFQIAKKHMQGLELSDEKIWMMLTQERIEIES